MSFVFFFFVLSGYFVLRPIRDAVAAASGVQQLPWLFAGTLTATLLFNPIFTSLVVKFPARKFVPSTTPLEGVERTSLTVSSCSTS